jgi:hypothetical protein
MLWEPIRKHEPNLNVGRGEPYGALNTDWQSK